MSNIDDLKAALIVTANTITITVEKLYALDLIDRWYAARTAVDSTISGGIVSYSIGGRSVTKADADKSRSEADALWNELMAVPEIAATMRKRGGGLFDARGNDNDVTQYDMA